MIVRESRGAMGPSLDWSRPWVARVAAIMVVATLLILGLPTSIHTSSVSLASPDRSGPLHPVGGTGGGTDSALLGATTSFGSPGAASASSALTLGWTNRSSGLSGSATSAPGPRSADAMTYDPALHSVILFGGATSSYQALGDTWAYSKGQWTNITNSSNSPPARWEAGFTYDAADGYAVLFGGRNRTQFFNDTWAFTTNGWKQIITSVAPTPRGQVQMTYDGGDAEVLLFGGGAGNVPFGTNSPWGLNAETWSFSGGVWKNLTGTAGTSPPPTQVAGFTYDNASGYVLLYAGTGAGAANGGCSIAAAQTWSFHGGSWTNRTSSANASGPGIPGGLDGPGMSFDPALGKVVLFGGTTESSGANGSSCYSLASTWTYTNGSWVNITSALSGPSPLARQWFPMTYDAASGELLLMGGNMYGSNGFYGDTWSFGNGSLAVTVTASPARGVAPLSSNLSVRVAGGIGPYQTLWQFGDGSPNGTGLSVRHNYSQPGSYVATVTVNDSAGDTASGSVSIQVLTTWQANHDWVPVGGSHGPSARSGATAMYDPALKSIILFGGTAAPGSQAFGDTWEYSNGTWIDATTSFGQAPPARWDASFVYDAADGYGVLFGGRNQTQFFNDTWEFNQSGWTQLFPHHAPSPRGLGQMTYDAGDGYVLYFGGGLARDATRSSNWQTFSDTWSFHAGQWTNLSAHVGTPPPALMTAGMAYDPASNVTLFYGGAGPDSGDGGCVIPTPQLWSYGNGSWKNLTPSNGTKGPGAAGGLEDLGLTYDPQIGGLLLFGGTTSGSAGCYSLAETWTYINGTWTNLTGALATPVPGAREWFPLVYDMADGYAFLSGGNDYGTTTYYADSWALGNLTTTPPALEITTSDRAAPGSDEVTFSAVAPSGPVPTLLKWEFGDGSVAATGPTVTHEYPGPGVYLPLLMAYEGPSLMLIIRLPAIDLPGPPATVNPGPPTAFLGPSFLLGSTAGLAVGVLVGAAVVVGWNARKRRLRAEGLALVSTARGPNEPR